MVKRTLSQLKPGAPRRIHLLPAATLWSLTGSSLFIRRFFRLIAVNGRWIIIPALIAGTLKPLFILDHSARKGVHRILELADGTCLGAVYSVKTWLLILFMMGSGMVLRHSTLPREILGGTYVTIGWALFFSSRHAWLAWRLV